MEHDRERARRLLAAAREPHPARLEDLRRARSSRRRQLDVVPAGALTLAVLIVAAFLFTHYAGSGNIVPQRGGHLLRTPSTPAPARTSPAPIVATPPHNPLNPAPPLRRFPSLVERDDILPPGATITYYAGPGAPKGLTTLYQSEMFWDGFDALELDFGWTDARGMDAEQGGIVYCDHPYGRITVLGDGSEVLGTLDVSISCATQPETIRIHNATRIEITINRLGTLVRGAPSARDTFARDDLVPPGGSLEYYAGAPRGRYTLARERVFSDRVSLMYLVLEVGGRSQTVWATCGWPPRYVEGPTLRDASGRTAGTLKMYIACHGTPQKVVLDSDSPLPIRVRRVVAAPLGYLTVHGGDVGWPAVFALTLRGEAPRGDSFYAVYEDEAAYGRPRLVRVPMCGAGSRRAPLEPCAGGGAVYRQLEPLSPFPGTRYWFVRRTTSGREQMFDHHLLPAPSEERGYLEISGTYSYAARNAGKAGH